MTEDSTSRHHREEGDPVRLRKRESGWLINFGMEARAAGIEPGDYVVVDLEAPETDPLLVVGVLAEPPENPEQDPLVRKVAERGTGRSVTIPPSHLDDRGLDLARESYDNDTPLLFEPLLDDGLVGLQPVRYTDGTGFVPPGDREDESAGSPADATEWAADESGPDAVGPIKQEAIAAAAQLTGTKRPQVRTALQQLAERGPDVDVLADIRAYPAVETPEGVVHVVESDAWDALDAPEDPAVRQAVRQAHVRTAERLFDSYAPDHDGRGFAPEYEAVVLLTQ
jgi:hypothetical protein